MRVDRGFPLTVQYYRGRELIYQQTIYTERFLMEGGYIPDVPKNCSVTIVYADGTQDSIPAVNPQRESQGVGKPDALPFPKEIE